MTIEHQQFLMSLMAHDWSTELEADMFGNDGVSTPIDHRCRKCGAVITLQDPMTTAVFGGIDDDICSDCQEEDN